MSRPRSSVPSQNVAVRADGQAVGRQAGLAVLLVGRVPGERRRRPARRSRPARSARSPPARPSRPCPAAAGARPAATDCGPRWCEAGARWSPCRSSVGTLRSGSVMARPPRGSRISRPGDRGCCRSSPCASGCKHAVRWTSGSPSSTATSGGSLLAAQSARALGQRGWKRQPDGGSTGDGMSPPRTICSRLSAASGSGARQRRQQRPRVGVPGPRRTARPPVAGLDDLAEVHHRDPVADVPHHGQVVGDEEVGEPELVLQVDEQVDAPAPGSRRRARTPARRRRSAWAAAPAPGPPRCAAAGHRRTRPGTGCSAPG